MNKNVTIAIILTFFSLLSFGQAKLDYDNDSRWFWGFNVGSTWHSTDVKTKTDWGYGFTLGRSFNYNYGKKVSFDFRGRYLYGEWIGQDNSTTDFTRINNALSTGETNYKDSLGFSVNNFQARMHRIAIELVLHANGLRERTGWDLYVFGGVGISGFQTRGNLLDATGAMYEYDSLPDYTTSTLNGALDKTYESTLDGSTSGRANFAMAPSLGFGIGYQVGKRFSMGLEHKTTFTRVDYFDGVNNPEGARENDLYHYTSAYLRFQVKKRNWDNHVTGGGGGTGTGDPMQAPDVYFTNPSASGTTVTNPNYQIRAMVKDVNDRDNINFRQNGVYMGSFTYNPNTDKMECPVVLQPGQNTFEIIASNAYGSDQASTVVVYQLPQMPMPIVNILNPSSNPHNTTSQTFKFTASVLNLQQYNQATVNVNGQLVSNFSFDPTTGSLSLPLNLTVGTNVVTVTGTNQVGTDSETTTIIYNPVVTVQPPVVYFVDPAQNPYQTNQNTYAIQADVLNVAGQENIVFKQNGSINQNFTYNANSDDFYSTVILNPGQNVFEIIATNASGVAQATTIIVYDYQAPRPPVVTISNPPLSPYTTENTSFSLSATVLNVTGGNQINMTLNGVPVTNFDYQLTTRNLSALLNLVQGTNTVVIKATNTDGTDSKQTTIIYNKPISIQPPLVTFVNPSTNPYTTSVQNMAISATVLNVDNSSGINVNINGTNITSFSFNNTSKILNFNTTLIEGANVITITGTNTAGIDSKSSTVIYKKKEVIVPPIVTFTDPIQNPYTVFDQTYNVKARVQHVNGQQDIQVRINGNLTSAFSYNKASEMLSFSTGLVLGSNIVEVRATNTAGTDAKSTTIIFRQSEPLLPPTVTINTPVLNPYTTNAASTNIEATVLNVEAAQNIQVLVNNIAFTGFTYQLTTRKLNMVMSLKDGANTIVIKAVNTAGEAQDSRTINYIKEVKIDPPLVTYINPSQTGLTVNTANYTVKARILNIENATQLSVKQNGQVVNPSLYTYNAASKEMTLNTGLSAGNNIFMVKATNTSGTHSATTSITYKQDEVPCNKPTVKFLLPNASGLEIAQSKNNIKLLTANLTAASQVQVFVNGVLLTNGNFNPSSKIYDAVAIYTEGQNTVEAIVKNACGEEKVSTTVIYKPAGKPCEAPGISMIQPLGLDNIVQVPAVEVRFSLLNISEASQVQFKVNGQAKAFNYDKTTHLLIATVDLAEGLNTIDVVVSNDCGAANKVLKYTRRVCSNPQVTIISSSLANNSITFLESMNMEGSVSNITNAGQLVLKQNGKPIALVFNLAQQSFTADIDLLMGKNNFELSVKNDCGTDTKTLVVERKADPNAVPPTIKITNPATTPYTTNAGSYSVQAVATRVTAANQVSMTINGQPVNAHYNVGTAVLSYNLTLVEGNNVIVVNAVNNYGSASDTKTIVYTKPIVVEKPVIVLTNPATCPTVLPAGTHQIKGYILNITDLNQVSIKINNVAVSNFNPVLVNGKLNFQFNITLSSSNKKAKIDITAANTGGSDAKSCEVNMEEVIVDNNCMPVVTAVFSEDSKTVTVRSTKDLSNVVVKYFDGTVQKFDGLTGLTGNFSGTGAGAGKCIIGVWIKSGCNQSTDGPGYGQWVANSKNVGSCTTSTGGGNTDCIPVVTAIFTADSKSVTVTSTKDLINVVLKYYDGQEQKFDGLSGTSKTLKGTGANNGKCIIGVWIKSGCNRSTEGVDYGQWVENKNNVSNCGTGNGNNGHGNNEDGNDESNPGNGGGGPNGETGGSEDDENGKGGGKTGGGGNKPPTNGGGKTGGGKTTPPTNTGTSGGKTTTPPTGTKTTGSGTSVKPTNTNPTNTNPTNSGGTKPASGTKTTTEGKKTEPTGTTSPPTGVKTPPVSTPTTQPKPTGTRGGGL